MAAIRIVVTDDQPILRMGLSELLAREPDLMVVGQAENHRQALAMCQELRPDVLVLDVEMPDLSGMEVARRLQGSPTAILALCVHANPSLVRHLHGGGVAGCVFKGARIQALIEAMRAVARGEEVWPDFGNGPLRSGRALTDRELEILKQVELGKTNQAIAVVQQLSVKTVEKHLSSIYRKLGVRSRVEAVVAAIRRGLI